VSKTAHCVLALAAAALLLAGCTAAPTPTPTPTATADAVVRAEDCAALTAALNSSIQAMSGMTPEQIAADPVGAIDLLDSSVAAIATAVEATRDPELRAAAEDTVRVMSDYVDTLRTAAVHPDTVDKTLLTAQASLVQEQLQVISGLCS
jgi:hypothetical protein